MNALDEGVAYKTSIIIVSLEIVTGCATPRSLKTVKCNKQLPACTYNIDNGIARVACDSTALLYRPSLFNISASPFLALDVSALGLGL